VKEVAAKNIDPTWILVADGTRARLFKPDETKMSLRPVELPAPVAVEVDRYACDGQSGRPGRRFSAALAWALDCCYAARKFDRLLLIVPPRTLGELRLLLPERVQAHMQVIAKDMTKSSMAELWSEVAPSVRRHRLTDAAF
jgi:protein required for attachment to host cells